MLALLVVVALAVPAWQGAAADGLCDADDPLGTCPDTGVGGGVAAGAVCVDKHPSCLAWSRDGECENNSDYMLESCRRSCLACGTADGSEFGVAQLIRKYFAAEVREVLSSSAAYIRRIRGDPAYANVWRECRNLEESCSEWALDDGCDDNPGYMKTYCSPACQSCDYVLEMKRECLLDPAGKDVIEPGGMNALFERIVRVSAAAGWQPTVLSRPAPAAREPACGEDLARPCDVHEGPWIVTLENFVSEDEVTAILDLADGMGYERSQAGDEVINARTSSQVWCQGECAADPVVAALEQRIASVTGIPTEHYEYFQLLQYDPGQYYHLHTDFIKDHLHRAPGPRLLTFFIYFNKVELGGGTRFPREGLMVEPRRGKVLIWPSVLDDDLYQVDERTRHEAIRVEAGQKYSANVWIHMRDFRTPHARGCPS